MSKVLSDATEVISFKVTPALKKKFAKKCMEGSWSKAEIIRSLIKNWIKETKTN